MDAVTGAGSTQLWVVSPCFNEEAGIAEFLAELDAVRTTLPDYRIHVLLVDDGSTDGTLAILKDLTNRDASVHVVSLSRNFGHQAAIWCGLAYARPADAVIVMDSDLQHPPALIPRMLEMWRAGADVVQCVRSEEEGTGVLKRITSRMFYRVFNWFSETKIVTGASDFYLLSRAAADVLDRMPERHRFLRGMVAWGGMSRALLTYRAQRRRQGVSKYSPPKMIGLAVDAITSFTAGPLRIVSRSGMALVVAGLVYLLYVLWVRIDTNTAVPGWASVVGLVLVLGGAQLVSLGIIGEYVARVFEEVKGRPHYVVKFRSKGLDDGSRA